MKSIRIPLLVAALSLTATGAFAHPAGQDATGPGRQLQGQAQMHGYGHGRHAQMHGKAHDHGRATHHGVGPAGRAFGRLDADRDGEISRAELDAASQRRAQMFERADADRDGKVTRAELVAMRDSMRERGCGQAREPLREHRRGAGPAAPASGAAPGIDYLG